MENTQSGQTLPELYWFGKKVPYAGLLKGRNRSIVISYMNLRRLIGWLGILLAPLCVIGGRLFACLPVQSSISYYYHSNMRDFFIGVLLAVSAFLITYKGERTIDSVVTWVIGLAGIAVALFPTQGPPCSPAYAGLFRVRADVADAVHLTGAAIFFFLLALNSLFLFTLSKHKVLPVGSRKNIRNVIYIACGAVILLCLLLFPILKIAMGAAGFKEGSMVLLLESVMLTAFGVSWLVKGGTILKDAKREVKKLHTKK